MGRPAHPAPGFLLYALQTASLNLKQTDLEPIIREQVVIDPGSVRDTQLGENVWDEQDFEDDDEEEADGEGSEENNDEETGEDQDEVDQEEGDEEREGEDDEDQQYRDGQDFAKMLLDHLGLLGRSEDENETDDQDKIADNQRRPAG